LSAELGRADSHGAAAQASPGRQPGLRLRRGRNRASDTPGGPGPSSPGAPAVSLQRQLQRQLLALLTVVWLLAAAGAGLGLGAKTDEVLDGALKETAERLLMLPERALAEPDTAERLALLGPHDECVVYQVLDAQGGLLLRSHQAPQQTLDPHAPDGLRQAGPWLVRTLSAPDGRRRAQVAETTAHRREVMWSSMAWLLGMLAALLPVAGLGTGWLLRRAFASLEPSRRALAQRPPHDLRPLPAHAAPLEWQPWLETVNALLARVADLVDSERAFAANTAHELRTPLAAARAQAQRLVQASTQDHSREQAQALLRQLDRLTHLATRLLQLARIESGVALQRAPVDLVQLATLVAGDFAEAQRAGRLWLSVHGPSIPVHGDLDALGIALRNLIDNALKHGGESAQVRVHIQDQQVTVEDNGPGVPAHTIHSLVGQFERGDNARALAGSGLGLAMVSTIARQSGAQLVLQSPLAAGPGFSASLRFHPDAQGQQRGASSDIP